MIELERTFDAELVHAIVSQPDIWADISQDGNDSDAFMPDMLGNFWILAVTESQIVGLFRIHEKSPVVLEIHPIIFKEYRSEYAKPATIAVYQWILHSLCEYEKLIAEIPSIMPHVIRFARLMGMEREGTNRQSFKKDGELYDQVYLGITRAEIDAYLRART